MKNLGLLIFAELDPDLQLELSDNFGWETGDPGSVRLDYYAATNPRIGSEPGNHHRGQPSSPATLWVPR